MPIARQLVPELMDDPDLPADDHARALDGLARLNHVSLSARATWRAIESMLPPAGQPPVRLLDVATGSADVPLALWQLARRHGRSLDITACDVSARALEIARHRADRRGASMTFVTRDALEDPLPGPADIVTCSLFAHHLDRSSTVRLLHQLAAVTTRRLVVNDLARSRRGVALAWSASRVLTRSHVVHVDALRSARAAWTGSEFAALAREAGLEGARVARIFPCRFLLTWSPPS